MSIKYGLLALLEHEPQHGYQLRVEFERSTAATWPLNVGQVYTTLARLERDGLVEEIDTEHDGQRCYQITKTGQDELTRWFASPVSAEPSRSELAIKLAMATRTKTPEEITHIVQVQRSATLTALRDYTRARERAGDDLAWLLVADRLIFNAEAEIRWLDHCEARLLRAVKASPHADSATTSATEPTPPAQQSKAGKSKARA